LRTLVLAAGVLLVGSLAVFLARGKLKNPLNLKELPQRLGVNIAADASGFTLDHSFGGHSRYRIHASKAVQFKDNHAILHDVKIELYGDDQSRVDRIEGAEFEYDKNDQTAKASGPVEITLMRPGQAPAVAGDAHAVKTPPDKTGKDKLDKDKLGKDKVNKDKVDENKATPIAAAAAIAGRDEIHVKTSGLTFDIRSGVATTAEHVDFSTVQGSGSSMGANYDSQKGFLVLDRAVELNTRRSGSTVLIHAQHAEFERDSHLCRLHAATANYRGGEATAGDAKVLFRDDGSAARLDAVNGFNLVTATGGHIAAPTGFMEFDEHNQPQHGRLEGGVRMDSTRLTEDGAVERRMRGSSAAAELDFTPKGELRHAHLQRGVEMASEQLSDSVNGPLRVNRTWKSPLADVEFRDNGKGQAEPATIHGVQGVVVTGESQRGKAAAEPSRLAADEVTGQFGPDSALSAMTGMGHASVEETNAAGARQTSTGDRLEAHFVQQQVAGIAGVKSGPGQSGTGQIQSAVLDGHVVLTQQPAPKPATQKGAEAPSPLRAWAGRAVYDGAGEWLHLTLSPRVENGGMQMTADKIDVSHASGDAFAHGNVKATWLDSGSDKAASSGKAGEQSTAGNSGDGTGQGNLALGGKGPTHVVAAEAQLSHGSGGDSVATFRGHARMWQQADSVAGPVIVLDRAKQTLVATSTDPAEPVKAVLLSTGGLEAGSRSSKPAGNASGRDSAAGEVVGKNSTGKPPTPSVIRVRGGDLKYSDAEHKAVMRGGALGTVVAETPTATSASDEAELLLLPPGNHAGKDGGSAQVDRMTARGHVVVTSGGRRGTGEQLVYTGETEEYVLTGTAGAPPRMTDPVRGNVTGAALIFHSRDDSVSIEGGGSRTKTETTTQK
jgi:lipopolysaccharide export system protein LptA